MCFSATASFTSAALLLPIGLYASRFTWQHNSRYWMLASFPLAFGVQQGFEGLTWLGLASNQGNMVQMGALGFLFFSHGFWLVWPALTVFMVEQRSHIKVLLLSMATIGLFLSLALYAPVLLDSNRFMVETMQGSITYHLPPLYTVIPTTLMRLIYMLIALGPLRLSEQRPIRLLSYFMAGAWLITYWLFDYAFVSVWCFFAAIASLYIAYILYSGLLVKSINLEERGG